MPALLPAFFFDQVTQIRSQPVTADLPTCKAIPGLHYGAVFPSLGSHLASPDVGVLIFSAPFAGLNQASVILRPIDDRSVPSVTVTATSAEASTSASILRAYLPRLRALTTYTLQVLAPVGRCQGDFDGTLDNLSTGAIASEVTPMPALPKTPP